MMDSEHIHTAFDQELEAVQALIMKMGGLVEQAIHDAARSLEHRDEKLAETVRVRDEAIDALETRVNEEAARVIALRAPTAGDLRTVLTVLKVSGNLERIGDYAKNIAKRTSVLARLPEIEDSPGTVRRMARHVERMLNDVLDAYVRRDAALAHDVRDRDEDVDQIYNSVFREFLTHMMEDPRSITACMHLHFIAKNIERMGDHITSIAEQTIYLATGELPEEARTKGDRTSFAGATERDGSHG